MNPLLIASVHILRIAATATVATWRLKQSVITAADTLSFYQNTISASFTYFP
jgi:hypothetical protein